MELARPAVGDAGLAGAVAGLGETAVDEGVEHGAAERRTWRSRPAGGAGAAAVAAVVVAGVLHLAGERGFVSAQWGLPITLMPDDARGAHQGVSAAAVRMVAPAVFTAALGGLGAAGWRCPHRRRAPPAGRPGGRRGRGSRSLPGTDRSRARRRDQCSW